VPNVLKYGNLKLLEPSGLVSACNGIALPLTINLRACNEECFVMWSICIEYRPRENLIHSRRRHLEHTLQIKLHTFKGAVATCMHIVRSVSTVRCTSSLATFYCRWVRHKTDQVDIDTPSQYFHLFTWSERDYAHSYTVTQKKSFPDKITWISWHSVTLLAFRRPCIVTNSYNES
jgi:hypothetical protein